VDKLIIVRHVGLVWIKRGIYFCLFGMFCIAAGAAEEKSVPDIEDLLGQLEKQHSNIKTLAVRFRQEKHFSFMNKPVVSKGFMVFSVPDKIRFDIIEPFATTLLDNGKKIDRYEFADGKWRALKFTGGKSIKLVMEQIGQWMQGKFSGQKKIFSLSVSVEDPNSYVSLVLEPRHKQFRRYIEKIRVSISAPPAYKISRIDIFEPEGDRFALDFVQELVNRDLPKDCFSDPKTASLCKKLFPKEKPKSKPQEDDEK
jgi:hypothetical protein